ncbi:MAG: hypothetical protein WAX04_10325, partial [Oscillospiraceae bacterium]
MTSRNTCKSDLSIDYWVEQLRLNVLSNAPDLIELFDLYASEAKFGRKYISGELNKLKHGAEILEVGAGTLILSTQLAREGYNLTALEPTGSGFSHFNQLREIVVNASRLENCIPNLIEISAENLE